MTVYQPTEDPTPVLPAPVVKESGTDRIVCEHCGRLTRLYPIARPVPVNAPPALERKTCVAPELIGDAGPEAETVRMPSPGP